MAIKVWMIYYIIYQCFIEENVSTENNGGKWLHKNNLKAQKEESDAGLNDFQQKLELLECNLRNKINQNTQSVTEEPKKENIQYVNKEKFDNSPMKRNQEYIKNDDFINYLNFNNGHNNNAESHKKLKYLYYINELLSRRNSLNSNGCNKNLIIENKFDLSKHVTSFGYSNQNEIQNDEKIPKSMTDNFLKHKPIKYKNDNNELNPNNNASNNDNRSFGKLMRKIKFMKKPVTEMVYTSTPFLENRIDENNINFKFEDVMGNNNMDTTTKKIHIFPLYMENFQVKNMSIDQDPIQRPSNFGENYQKNKTASGRSDQTMTDKEIWVINFFNCSIGNINISTNGVHRSNDGHNEYNKNSSRTNSETWPDNCNSDSQQIDKTSNHDKINNSSERSEEQLSAKNYLVFNNSGKVILNFLNCQKKDKFHKTNNVVGDSKVTSKICAFTEDEKRNQTNENFSLFSQENILFFTITTDKDTLNVKRISQEYNTQKGCSNYFQDSQKNPSNNETIKHNYIINNERQQKTDKNYNIMQNKLSNIEKIPVVIKNNDSQTKTSHFEKISRIYNTSNNLQKLGKSSQDINNNEKYYSSESNTLPTLFQSNKEHLYYNTSSAQVSNLILSKNEKSTNDHEYTSSASQNKSLISMTKFVLPLTKNKMITTIPVQYSFPHKPYKAKKFWNILGKFNSNGNDKTTVMTFNMWEKTSKSSIIKYNLPIRNSSIITYYNTSDNSIRGSHQNANKKYLYENKKKFLQRLQPMARYISKKSDMKEDEIETDPKQSNVRIKNPLEEIDLFGDHHDNDNDDNDEDDDDNDENVHTMMNTENFQFYKYLIDKSLTYPQEMPRTGYKNKTFLVMNNIPYKKDNLIFQQKHSFNDRTSENIKPKQKLTIRKIPNHLESPPAKSKINNDNYDTIMISFKNISKNSSHKNKKQKIKSTDNQYLKLWPFQNVRLKKVLTFDPNIYSQDMNTQLQENNQQTIDVGAGMKQDEVYLFQGKEITNTPLVIDKEP